MIIVSKEVNKMNVNNSLSQNFNPYVNSGKFGGNTSSASPQNTEKNDNSQKTEKNSSDSEKKIKTSKDDFTPYQQKIIEELKSRDQEVRDHEMAHVAAGGPYIKRGANYQYQKGPDGILYAVGGDVLIDTSPVAGSPEATIRKMDVIRSAALAPANPSGSDRAIASRAATTKIKANEELIKIQLEKSGLDKGEKKSPYQVSDQYSKSQNSPDQTGQIINMSA